MTVNDRIARIRERGYLAAGLVGLCWLGVGWPDQVTLRLLVGLAAGGALLTLIRWEQASARHHRLGMLFVDLVRVAILLAALAFLVWGLIRIMVRSVG